MPEKEANVLPRIDIGLVSESCIDCPATLATFKVVLQDAPSIGNEHF